MLPTGAPSTDSFPDPTRPPPLSWTLASVTRARKSQDANGPPPPAPAIAPADRARTSLLLLLNDTQASVEAHSGNMIQVKDALERARCEIEVVGRRFDEAVEGLEARVVGVGTYKHSTSHLS